MITANLTRAGRLWACALWVLVPCLFAVLPARVQAEEIPPELTHPRLLEIPEPKAEPKAVPYVVPRTPSGELPAEAESVRFVLSDIMVDGNTVISDTELKDLYVTRLGSEISLAEVYAIARDLTALYRARGYILSEVIVPPQRIGASGAVHLQAIEGYISSYRIEGTEGDPKLNEMIGRHMAKIVDQKPLESKTLERYLNLLNDRPGVRVRTVLAPAEAAAAPGAAMATVQIERVRLDGALSFHNQGSENLGKNRGSILMGFNRLLSAGDRTEVGVSQSLFNNQITAANVAETVWLGSEGVSVRAFGRYTRSNPDIDNLGVNLDVKGETVAAGLEVNYPFIRKRDLNVTFTGGAEYLSSEVESLGSQLSEDELRVLKATLNVDFADRTGAITASRFDVRQGLDVLGASDDPTKQSRADGNSDATTLSFTLVRNQPVYGRISLYGVVSGQYALSETLAPEEFSVGGSEIGRGYEPSEVSGDHGLGAALELRYSDSVGSKLLSNYQIFAFVDGGKVWEIGNQNTGASSVASTGGGVRLNLGNVATVYGYVAFPIGGDVSVEGDSDPRAFGALTIPF